jgi:hypothetical protein
LKIAGFLSLVVLSLVLAGTAQAAHCPPVGDKDHLPNGQCGYFVDVSPPPSPSSSPSPTPTPTSDVRVINEPTVNIQQPPADQPLRTRIIQDDGTPSYRVEITNWRQVSASQGGLSEQDSENLERLATDVMELHKVTVIGFAVAVFALLALIPLGLRR